MQLGHIFSSASFCDLMLSVAASAFAVFSSVQPSSPSHPYVAKATRMHQSERSWIRIEYNKDKNFIHLNLYNLPLAVTAALCQFSFPEYLHGRLSSPPYLSDLAILPGNRDGKRSYTPRKWRCLRDQGLFRKHGSRLTVDWTDLYWCTELYWLIGYIDSSIIIYYNPL